jgi:hypothetical protein
MNKSTLLGHTLSVSGIGGNGSGHRKFMSLRVTVGEVKKGLRASMRTIRIGKYFSTRQRIIILKLGNASTGCVASIVSALSRWFRQMRSRPRTQSTESLGFEAKGTRGLFQYPETKEA